MKKQSFISFALAVLLVPQVSLAAWWNPTSWFKKTVAPVAPKVFLVASTASETKRAVATTTPKTVREVAAVKPKKQTSSNSTTTTKTKGSGTTAISEVTARPTIVTTPPTPSSGGGASGGYSSGVRPATPLKCEDYKDYLASLPNCASISGSANRDGVEIEHPLVTLCKQCLPTGTSTTPTLLSPRQPTLASQDSQEQKIQEGARIATEQKQLREAQTLARQKATEERQNEIKKQQLLENQRLAEEKARVATPPNRDLTSPTIPQIRIQRPTDTKNYAIEWTTNEPTLGKVNFGGCSIAGCENASSLRILQQNESYSLDHQIIIDSDLKPATEYKYYIYATDEAGNEAGFYDGKFTTELPVPLPELNGQYNTDIILTKDKSPYFVTGDVFINKKLQIDPGVKIKFGAYKLVINRTSGDIRVNGIKNEPVSFEFVRSPNDNNGIYIHSNSENIIN